MDAAVIVATALDVGRTGTTRFGSSEVNEEVDIVENGGHDEGPHSRSVAQQPPPRLEAQERKPGEHANVVEDADEGDVGVVVTVNATDEEDVVIFVDVGDGADELVVGDCKAVVVERRERVTVGMTTTVVVDIRTPGDRSVSQSGIYDRVKVSQPTSIHS